MKKLTSIIVILWWSWAGLPAQTIPGIAPVPGDEKLPLEVEFAPEGGFYEDDMVVELFAPGATIYYTTNGTRPRRKRDYRYKGPFRVDETMTIRATAYKGREKSNVFSHTYFIREPETTFPVVAISLTPGFLFDPEYGLFMTGSNAIDTLWYRPGANYWSRRELPVNVEIFESDGQCVYRSLSGFRIFGGMSRLFPQKSLTIVARKRYGQKRIKHPIFGKDGLKKFKFLVLRNSGSDFGKTHFRDGLMTGLLDEWDIEKQDYRPAHVYINGDYWGIYNIREKVNRYFIEDHHKGVDKDSINLIEHRLIRKRGRTRPYRELLAFLEENDLSQASNFVYVESQMEVDNYMNHQIAQIYFDNRDAGGNIKFWRPQKPGGKWRWILYDTDWGFGLHEKEAFKNNSLAFHTEPDGPSWPNPPWSTFILRKLLENKQFEHAFINRFADHLNTTFESFRVEKKIDELYTDLLPEMPRHLKRWRLRESVWREQVQITRTFARKRPEYLRMYLMDRFNTGALRHVEIETSHGGHVLVNDYVKVDSHFSGDYFENIPIEIEAIPKLGYRFSHWTGIPIEGNERELTLELRQKKYDIRAVFEKVEHPLAGKVILNEISPNNKASGDWLEIYNHSDRTVNLKNWILTDSKNEFHFPQITLFPKDYIVLCQDSASFEKVFPRAYNTFGGLGFGLNKRKETIGLYAPDGSVVDSIGYDIEPRDSVFTLNLLLPWLNNGDFDNWELLAGPGTPNSANRYYVESTIQARRDLWMQIGGAFSIIMICVVMLVFRQTGKI